MAGRNGILTALPTALLFLLLLTGCSQLGVFNAVIPHDRGSMLVARDVGYGPLDRQKLDVYAPASDARADGVIVFFYGGSWNSGRKEDYAFAAKALATRGYVTIVFDYRLVPAIRYPAFVEDGAKAVAWAHRNAGKYGGDTDRLFVLGHSAGAYNAMMVTLAPEFLTAEGLSPAVIRAGAGLSGPYDFLPLDVDAAREAFRGVADLDNTQPVNRVRRDQAVPPLFLATGDADDVVMPRNTKALASTLR
nr:alpha/beta hydrolase [Pseudaminobacter sp.]